MKLKKALILIIMLAVFAWTLTAIAFAAEEAVTSLAYPDASKNYDSLGDGDTIQNASNKYGKAVAVKQDNGNVYMLLTYADITTSGTQAENVDIGAGKHYLPTYPYAMFSFDIMSPQGTHSSETYFAVRLYNGTSSIGYFTDAYVNFSSLGLSSTPYEWQHLSVVVEQDAETLNFKLHVFVNGELAKVLTSTMHTSTISAEGYDKSKLCISYSKFNTPKSSSEIGKDTAIDNFNITYFKTGATIEQMANYN